MKFKNLIHYNEMKFMNIMNIEKMKIEEISSLDLDRLGNFINAVNINNYSPDQNYQFPEDYEKIQIIKDFFKEKTCLLIKKYKEIYLIQENILYKVTFLSTKSSKLNTKYRELIFETSNRPVFYYNNLNDLIDDITVESRPNINTDLMLSKIISLAKYMCKLFKIKKFVFSGIEEKIKDKKGLTPRDRLYEYLLKKLKVKYEKKENCYLITVL